MHVRLKRTNALFSLNKFFSSVFLMVFPELLLAIIKRLSYRQLRKNAPLLFFSLPNR